MDSAYLDAVACTRGATVSAASRRGAHSGLACVNLLVISTLARGTHEDRETKIDVRLRAGANLNDPLTVGECAKRIADIGGAAAAQAAAG